MPEEQPIPAAQPPIQLTRAQLQAELKKSRTVVQQQRRRLQDQQQIIEEQAHLINQLQTLLELVEAPVAAGLLARLKRRLAAAYTFFQRHHIR